MINRKKQSVSLDVATKKVSLDRKLAITATSSAGGQIKVLQNSRVVASLTSDQVVEIDAAKLGLGETKLRAIQTAPDGTVIASSPVTVEITQ